MKLTEAASYPCPPRSHGGQRASGGDAEGATGSTV